MVLNIVLFSRARKRVHGLRKMRHRPTAHHAPSLGDTPVQHTTFLLTKHRPLHFDLPPDSLPASSFLPQKPTSTAVVRVRGHFHMQKYPTLPPRRRPPVFSTLPDFCLFRDETPCRARAASACASPIRFLPLSRSFVRGCPAVSWFLHPCRRRFCRTGSWSWRQDRRRGCAVRVLLPLVAKIGSWARDAFHQDTKK